MKNLKKIPKFKSEAEEVKFWNENDSAEYLDWNSEKSAAFPQLQPPMKAPLE